MILCLLFLKEIYLLFLIFWEGDLNVVENIDLILFLFRGLWIELYIVDCLLKGGEDYCFSVVLFFEIVS